jgi:serine/threonine-protein kinase RsbW
MQPWPAHGCRGEGKVLTLVLGSDAWEVRAGLVKILSLPLLADLSVDMRENVQLVLAEVLNNIVEHAYAGRDGVIRVRICREGGDLRCDFADDGRSMPSGLLPAGELPMVCPEAEAAEGGYGWALIRMLSSDLRYQRDGGENRLSFRLGAKH